MGASVSMRKLNAQRHPAQSKSRLSPRFLTAKSPRAADRDAVHAQRGLADADRHALAVLAAGADAGVELEVVADHADAIEVGRAIADQHGALERSTELAVLDAIGFGHVEHVLARGDVDLSAAEVDGVD